MSSRACQKPASQYSHSEEWPPTHQILLGGLLLCETAFVFAYFSDGVLRVFSAFSVFVLLGQACSDLAVVGVTVTVCTS